MVKPSVEDKMHGQSCLLTPAQVLLALLTLVPPLLAHMEPVEQVTVVQGSLVTLSCEARGMPPPSLSWLKDGQPLSLHRNLLLDGQETRLHLTAVASHDAGLYSCVASNAAGSSTKTFNLTVLGEKRPTSVAVLGQPVSLRCQVEGQPTPEITWLRDRRPVAEGARLRMFANGTLWLAAVQRTDSGLYTCSASNPAGRGSADRYRLNIVGLTN
uniref:Ig-like domain-containing protein n=1 Tax=Paramormyrops kingsleyae TaxID=1676925 RepID=A0A3B3QTK8_9TELE